MGSILVVLFWIWCGISVVTLITRPVLRRVRSSRPVDAASTTDSPAHSAGPSSADPDPPGQLESVLAGSPDASSAQADSSDASSAQADSTDTSSAQADSAATPPPTEPLAQPMPHAFAVPAAAIHTITSPVVLPGSTTPNPLTGQDVPRGPGGSGDSGDSGDQSMSLPTRSVADALSGIRMPCDLVPLIGPRASIDPTHVVFAADGHPAHDVGSRVGDELERIGCDLTQIDETTLHAARDSYVVEVRIHPDAAFAKGPAGPRFPTAPPGAVVVEFRLI